MNLFQKIDHIRELIRVIWLLFLFHFSKNRHPGAPNIILMTKMETQRPIFNAQRPKTDSQRPKVNPQGKTYTPRGPKSTPNGQNDSQRLKSTPSDQNILT